jgi:hypothetical protein
MQLSLLELTQTILSSLNSDQVNSISDTPESVQVAECIKTTYMNMLGRYDMPEHNQLCQLTPSGSEAQPVLMTRPEGTSRIEWIKYYDTNPADSSTFMADQYGAYSNQHDTNTDLSSGGSGWSTPSTTSNTIATGTQTFTVAGGLTINVADSATAYYGIPGFGGVSMSGVVASYSGTTLVLTITSVMGTGTYTNWTIVNASSPPVGPGYKEVRILPVHEFIRRTQQFNLTDSDVSNFQLGVTNADTGLFQNFIFNFRTDRQPETCCILSNYYIIFDSFDNTQDTTLQQDKSMALCWVVPAWQMTDTFIPNLQDQQVPLLLNDAKSLAFFEIKNQPHQKAEEEVSRQLVSLQKWKAIADHPSYFEELPDFGRRGGGFWGSGKRGDRW